MPIRSEPIIKWTLYALATLACCLLQGALLLRLPLHGIFPFLFPMLAALLGTFEGPVAGGSASIVLGALCDLTLAAPIPCFYTLIFPVVGLIAGLIAQGLLSAGLLCSLVTSVAAFLLTDLFHLLFLDAALPAALLLMAGETAYSLVFLIPIFFLFSAIHRKCHSDD